MSTITSYIVRAKTFGARKAFKVPGYVVIMGVISELTQQDRRGKKTANLV